MTEKLLDLVTAKYYSRHQSRQHYPIPFTDVELAIIEALEEMVVVKRCPPGKPVDYFPERRFGGYVSKKWDEE